MATLFCDTALAHRIERAETQLIVDASHAAQARSGTDGFTIPIAGAVASFAEPDSPFNKVVGIGFAGAPDVDELDAVEKAYAAHGAPTQVELAHLADSAVGELLSDRGYRLESFENVLGLALDTDPDLVAPAGIEVRQSGLDELDAWIKVVTDGAVQPDTQGLPWHDEFPAKRSRTPNATSPWQAEPATSHC
ncbi:MAG: hypothetical protein QOH17_4401, partial [Pseudonocardiales bacterium]|nr:hypothetical protein [Pseudonocardiales bacterium]